MKLKYFMLGMYLSAILCGVIFFRAVKQMPEPETKVVYVSEKDKMMIELEKRFVEATKKLSATHSTSSGQAANTEGTEK